MSRVGVRRGQIWLVDWTPGRSSEQSERRPSPVVQEDSANCNPKYLNTKRWGEVDAKTLADVGVPLRKALQP